ncbi:MAG: ABC transporter ATP-binding protein/permease [Eubacterium sp.]|nr:ABC transporter ATP-binding protein/permease [Eubacterium sp.]
MAAQARPTRGPSGKGREISMRGGKPMNSGKAIRRILKYIGKEWYMLLLAVLCVVVFSVTSLAGSYILKPITDQLSESAKAISSATGDVTGLISDAVLSLTKMLILLGSVYGLGILANYFQMRIMIGVSQRALIRIRKDLFDHLQDMPVRYFDSNSTGDIMSRFVNDIDAIGELLNNTVIQLISGVISIVGTLGIMLFENIWLSLVTIFLTPVMFIAAMGIGKRSAKYYKEQQAALGELNGYIEETVTGQKVVKVFNHEEEAVKDFKKYNDNLRNKQVKAQFLGGIMMPVMGNIGQICYGLTATIGGLMCFGGALTIGGLTIFVNYSRQFSRPINELSMQMNTLFSALAGAERVFTVMDMDTEAEDAEDAVEMKGVQGRVEIDHVSFGYDSKKTVLKDINLDVKQGMKIAFVGSTGAGKTTITNLLNRFYDVNEGKIRIDGRDISDYTLDSLRGNIAMVLQDTHLFSDTVRENIRYGRPDATDEEVEEAAKVASAHSFIMRLKDKYDTKLEGDGSNLSQGQRQLLNIARAAISKAPILVLDEATSSVDTRTEMHIDHGMTRLMKGRTTFVIAHRLSTVRNADCIMVLENGEIIERGKHEELLEMKGRYYQLYTGVAELT